MEIEHYLTRETYPWHCYRPPPERGSVGSSALEVDSACPHVLSARQEAGSSRSDPADSGWPIRLADRAWRFFPSYWGCPNPWRSREKRERCTNFHYCMMQSFINTDRGRMEHALLPDWTVFFPSSGIFHWHGDGKNVRSQECLHCPDFLCDELSWAFKLTLVLAR